MEATEPATWLWLWIPAGWAVLAAGWWLCIVPRLRRGPGGDATLGLAWWASTRWLRWRQHLEVHGVAHLNEAMAAGPVIIVANHTGGVDPLLVQSATSTMIHWMMARDMMAAGTEDIWRLVRVIPVNRADADARALRRAMGILRSGGVIGVFPEGRITRPPGSIRPFQEGVGLLAARTRARVVPCWISGTPDVDGMLASIAGRGRSRVEFLEPIRFDRSDAAAEVADDLRRRIAAASGWPCVDEPMPLILG
ncbi:MAG: lysophospholipid acyltransferase family protein [Phycisphaerales bacterium]|jgi:1-acyl-sn-glycerol-3-phosphate acyltransferase|nr:lysophospholipid acyltransferase family protein [Phycisphaerales bacterium]